MFIHSRKGKEYPLWRYAVLYSELEGKLAELREKYPENLRIEKIGKSHEDRDLFLVILTDDVTDDSILAYEAFRKEAPWNPDRVTREIEGGRDCKLPLFFNCNLHATEISGTDGMLAFIDELLSSDQRAVLNDVVILIAMCANPDGRARGIDILNGHAVDLNRDFAAQTQPETKAIIQGIVTRFYPTVMVDFHGYFSDANILIDTCTPPHNPNLEYDLYEKHLLQNARKMAEVIEKRLRLKTDIAAEIWEDGWEDYAPVFAATYMQNFGCIAHTLESNFPNEEGAAVALCTAVGAIQYAVENKNELLLNQCTYFERGLTNTSKALEGPLYYVIPFARHAQRDRGVIRDTLQKLLQNGIKVYWDQGAESYVIPTSQPLRGLIHNLLWQGELLNDKIKNMYDVSFYSYPIMRGFEIIERNELASDAELVEVNDIPVLQGTLKLEDNLPFLSFSSQSNDSIKVVNTLRRSGVEVFRASRNYAGGNAGDFLFRHSGNLPLIESILETHDLVVRSTELPDNVHRIQSPKILATSDSGGLYEILAEWGFDVTFLPFAELNQGYEIHPQNYDLLIFGGTRLHLWSDPFSEVNGIGYGNTFALRPRGRQEIIEAAGQFKNTIMFGYAGVMLNRMVGLIEQGDVESKSQEDITLHEKEGDWHLNTGSGSFMLTLDESDPLCYGYGKEQTVYVVGPIGLEETSGVQIPGHYAEQAFVNGWCQNQERLNRKPAMLYEKSEQGTNVLLGIDPCYRKYVDSTFRLMANAIFLTGY